MKHWFTDLLTYMQQGRLDPWADLLLQQLNDVLFEKFHGDQARWSESLNTLPEITDVQSNLNSHDLALTSHTITPEQQQQVEQGLRGLMPWRKGPFQFFDTHIETEWRSDWKWSRVQPHISPLKNRLVLDVGCGSGYHMWRMLGEGAARVIGVDLSRLFLMQFQAYKKYLALSGHHAHADLLPFKMEIGRSHV